MQYQLEAVVCCFTRTASTLTTSIRRTCRTADAAAESSASRSKRRVAQFHTRRLCFYLCLFVALFVNRIIQELLIKNLFMKFYGLVARSSPPSCINVTKRWSQYAPVCLSLSQGGYVLICVCLSVCLFVNRITQKPLIIFKNEILLFFFGNNS